MPGVIYKNGLTIGEVTYYVCDQFIQYDLNMNANLVS